MTDEGDPSERIRQTLEKRRKRVNAAIPEVLPIGHPDRLYEASRYLLDAGGKRLRPAMLLLVGEALAEESFDSVSYRTFPDLDGGTVDLLAAAVSVEVVHLFTLIHDDIMDDDDLRRGVPAVHQAYDMETAILAGDTLYSKAFEILIGTGAPPDRSVDALELLAHTCTEICEGQALDVGFENDDVVSVSQYQEMIERKTGVLYGASAAIPAVLLGGSDATIDGLYRFGVAAGCAFQIQDDVLDLVGDSDRLGKRRGSDLIEGKQTLITVHARNEGIDVDSLLPAGEVTEADIDSAVAALGDAGSLDYARETAREHVERGKDHLDVLPANQAGDRLNDIADYLVTRRH